MFSLLFAALRLDSAESGLPAPPQGCVIPSGSPKGSTGCETPPPGSHLYTGGEGKIRAKIKDVQCEAKLRGRFLADATVERWLQGQGPKQLIFSYAKPLKVGKGLSADFLIIEREGSWHLKEVTNRTSSEAALPSCP